MSDVDMTETNELLREIAKWLRVGFHEQVSDRLSETLDTVKKRRIYNFSNGVNTMRDIAKLCEVSTKTVVSLWDIAERKGLLETLPNGRKKSLFVLDDFGLNTSLEVKEVVDDNE